MFESRTNALPDSNSCHFQSFDVPIEVTTVLSWPSLASASRQASKWQIRSGDQAVTAMPLRSPKRTESRAIASGRTSGQVREPLSRLTISAQEELNRLHNIARQAHYELIICTPQGLAVDCDANPNVTLEVREPNQSIGLNSSRCGKDRAASERAPVCGAAKTPPSDDAAVVGFGPQFRIRHRESSAAAAFIFDADGAVIGALDIRPIGQNQPFRPDPLKRAIVQATARAIEERAFREEHRRE